MRNFPTLFSQFILRALLRQKVRTAVAVLGIALGVAVMIAVRMANRSVTDSFRAGVDAVSGQASLRIRGVTGRFDEQRLAGLAWLVDFGTVSPVVESYARLVPPAQMGPTLDRRDRGDLFRVLGVDALADTPIRHYRLLKTSRDHREPSPHELMQLLVDPHVLVLTDRFSRRSGVQIGDHVRLSFGARQLDFRVAGLLLDEGPARALDGNFILMDIAAAQEAMQKLGQIDYVDIKLRPGRDVDQSAAELQRRLPAGLTVEPPGARFERAQTMIAAFHFNLAALSGIALLVGLFLIYNTVTVSVASRREEIGMLQALGATRSLVVVLFLAEAALIASIGTVIGLALGMWLAGSAVLATATTVETFYIAEVARNSAQALSPTAGEIALAIGVTLPLALLSAAVPAAWAAGYRPVEVIFGAGRRRRSARPPRRLFALAMLLFAAGWLLTLAGPIDGRPVFGFAAQLLFTLAGALIVPGALWLACWTIRSRVAWRLPVMWIPGYLAASNLQGAVSRVSISVAALAVSLGMMVAVSVMVGSFRDTVVYWLNTTLRADLFVRPAMLASSVMEARMDAPAIARIRRDPDVVNTGWFTSRQIPYGQADVRLAASDVATILDQRVIEFKSPRNARECARRVIDEGHVLVSESFSLRFNKHPGDVLELPTPDGPRTFQVAAVYYDYASNQGTVLLDGQTFHRYYHDDAGASPTNLSIYLRPGADPETVRSRLAREVGADQDLYFATADNVRREAMRVFDSTFTITYALELIAIVIAGLGVISTLITLIYERQRDIALLSLVGATPRQVRRMVVVEAVLVGGVSQLVGLIIGLLLALVLIYVINVQSFGWTIQFHLPLGFLFHTTLLILVVSALCGLYPASRAANVHALEFAREE
jgi:putative ABC transport system permease protein